MTDEGLPTGSFPLIRRVPRHLPPRGKAFPAGDEVTPPYIAILPQSFLPRPYPINVRARRALRIYYLLSFIYYLFCPAGALSSPMVHLSAISWEIATKKTPLLPPLICTFHSFPRGLSRGLTKPHRGFVVGRYARRPTRPVLVPDGAPVRNILGNRNKKTPRNFLRGVYFGAPSGTRTQDPLIKSQLLSQVTSAKSSFESSYCCFKTQFF